MDTELYKLPRNSCSIITNNTYPDLYKLPRNSCSIITNNTYPDPDIIDDDDFKYTSLKDIILNSSSCYENYQERNNSFGSANILIRNQLVKHAASAYLQSTAILANRDQNCFVGLWRKMRNIRDTICTWWYVYFRNPIGACFQAVGYVLACMGDSIENAVLRRRIEFV